MKQWVLGIVVLAALGSAHGGEETPITLERIMAHPDWLGRRPERSWWSPRSDAVVYTRKQEGSELRDTVLRPLSTDGNGTVVPLSELHRHDHRNAVFSRDGARAAYTHEGDVFLVDVATGQTRQLTRTSGRERGPLFLTDGRLAYHSGSAYLTFDPSTGVLETLVDARAADEPDDVEDPEGFIEEEQHALIEHVARTHRNAKEREARRKARLEESPAAAPRPFYLGKKHELAGISLSPSGAYALAVVRDKEKPKGKTGGGTEDKRADSMPDFIAQNGGIETRDVRARVADVTPRTGRLVLLSLTNGEQTEIDYETLPGIQDDVLADVKRENHEARDETYEAPEEPVTRHVRPLGGARGIRWSDDGSAAAVMIDAWDSKDRWIATVDLESGALTVQHRLSDPAWINWRYNEMGWLSDGSGLWFLSEETGYSHLYVKPLDGEARALTSGSFEVNDVTRTRDGATFYFRANRPHPGVYEIYRLPTSGGSPEALTDLGGMTDYQLSPDESRLLLRHSRLRTPPELFVQNARPGAEASQLTRTVSDAFRALPVVEPRIVEIPSSHVDRPIYAKVYFPPGWTGDGARHRAVVFSHGAGYLQNSHKGWSTYFREFMFHSLLAHEGYVVLDMDYRASAGYGRDWRTAIYRRMGTPEIEDLVDGVDWLVENAHVDRDRIGTYGGSYGGFMTFMALFTRPGLFKAGAALRPVTDWAHYNYEYTANILNTPQDDPIAYRRSSPIYFAEGLEDRLLINAPMVDDNVFFQDTVRLVQRLIELEKTGFETAIYPVEPHGFREPSSWLDEYRRIHRLFDESL